MVNEDVHKILRNNLELVVLHLLKDKPSCGLDILTALIERGSQFSSGTIYPLLYKLREDGKVTVGSYAKSKIYKITDKGLERLDELIEKYSFIKEILTCRSCCEYK